MTLVFASNNKNKLREARSVLEPKFKILSLAALNFFEELPETSATIEGNAAQKAWFVWNKLKKQNPNIMGVFADDTGLEIEEISGRPGVLSARYAGAACNAEDNMLKVLQEMKGCKNRKAVFRCIISLIIDGKEQQFEGKMTGKILTEKRGTEGFGYDPIFQPDGSDKSFAQMSLEEKNMVSHRAVALRKMIEGIKN